jgi:CheY-like chemotaxis protein
LRVMLVEDDIDVLEVLATTMRRQKAEVLAVRSAKEALELLDCAVPDVLISDICMPSEDGYSLIRKVRAMNIHIPAAAVSANAGSSEAERALALGFQIFIPKPIDPMEFPSQIAALVGKDKAL